MTIHISARVAWHADGWDGRVCAKPGQNTYCVGMRSYPGQSIAEKRDLAWEEINAGRDCSGIGRVLPCSWSINAFGKTALRAAAEPPEFFRQGTPVLEWELPAATVCVWPYEEMYGDEVRTNDRFDYDARLARARDYFARIEPKRSLIFYYANYSNPFSDDQSPRYVLIGMSRIRELGPELFYTGASEEDREKYGGAFVWSRNVSSLYPDQGLRLPYHLYRGDRDALDRFVVFPENPRLCKYGTRAFSDDDALGLVDQLIGSVRMLRSMNDTSEDWATREAWLQAVAGELWQERGLYPGLPAVLTHVGAAPAIEVFRSGPRADHRALIDGVFAALRTGRGGKPFGLDEATLKAASRTFRLLDDASQDMLEHVLPRLELKPEQVKQIVSEDRTEHGLPRDLRDVAADPYLLCEHYVGDDPDDLLPWATVDRGVIPSPELGGTPLAQASADDPRRLRSLAVDVLRRSQSHTFLPASEVIAAVNARLDSLPEWKRHAFNQRHLVVDREALDPSLTQRDVAGATYVYLREAWDQERAIEDHLKFFVSGPDVPLRRPVTSADWRNWLHQSASPLASLQGDDYERAITGQVDLCERLFRRPLACIAGAAGTGKTTVVRAIVDGIRKAHGEGSAVLALAPTGKAADRLREVLAGQVGVRAETAHAFLARNGWLRDNLTIRPEGGKRETGCETVVIDECSMLDLELFAALTRALDRNAIRRLILVGDPNQLPPIGRGRVFADVVEWLGRDHPESIATLRENLRQMEGRATGRGTAIVDLAEHFVGTQIEEVKDESRSLAFEEILARVHAGGDVDKDLRIVFYDRPESLASLMLARIDADLMEQVASSAELKTYELWSKSFEETPLAWQILSPHRGELHGIESLNASCQAHVRTPIRARMGGLDGIELFDKVIQIRNRTRSRPLYAWDSQQRAVVAAEVFNGEIGLAQPHLMDKRAWLGRYYRLSRFQVRFARKDHLRVGYGKKLGQKPNGRWISTEKVEENLELGYAISIHKAQGSEFDRTYVVVPAGQSSLMSRELFYTALTRARSHCTLFVERDVGPLLSMRRRERSALALIRSSLFQFRAIPDALFGMREWYAEGKIHHTLAGDMVRSKSEVIIANLLFERDIPFEYEVPLYGSDGTFCLPDFTVSWRGEKYYWEHVGMLDRVGYREKWERKKIWYEKHHPERLRTTEEGPDLTTQARVMIEQWFR